MKTDKIKLPRGLEWAEDGSVRMHRCPKCNRENYIMNVTLGICTWCGYNANEYYNQNQDK